MNIDIIVDRKDEIDLIKEGYYTKLQIKDINLFFEEQDIDFLLDLFLQNYTDEIIEKINNMKED